MFGSIGGPELVLILVLALLLFGPRKLPEIGRTLGRALAEFRGVTSEFRTSLEREVDLDELRRTEREVRAASRETMDAARESPTVPRRLTPGSAEHTEVTPPGPSAPPSTRRESSAADAGAGTGETPDGSGDGVDVAKA